MTNGDAPQSEEESKADYLAAGMTEEEYNSFGTFVALRYALEDTGLDELAGHVRLLVGVIDRWVDRETQRGRILSEAAEDFTP